MYRCIGTDILPATCRYAGTGCPSACTTDCRSASHGDILKRVVIDYAHTLPTETRKLLFTGLRRIAKLLNLCSATKHRIGCIGHIGVQITLLLDMTQYKVVKVKRLGSVLVNQFSRAQPGWGLGPSPEYN